MDGHADCCAIVPKGKALRANSGPEKGKITLE